MDTVLFATIVFNLFLIIDPIACMPIFIAITKDNSAAERKDMVLRACIVAFAVLAFFAFIGNTLLGYFHITTPAVRLAGGILLFIIGIEMLFGRISRTESSEREEQEAKEKEDVSITPLAIPLLAGPGAIAAVMLFTGSTPPPTGVWYVGLAILVVMILSYIFLRLADNITHVIGHLGVKVVGRVMGLLLIFMAIQFIIDGLTAIGIAHI